VTATHAYVDTGYGAALQDRDGFVKVLASVAETCRSPSAGRDT
jgi:hypothetical protein